MADVNIDGVVTWLKNWFYDKTEIGTLLNAKANLNQNQANYNVVTDASGNITVEAKPTIPNDVSELTDTQNTAFTPKSHTHGDITNDGKITSTDVSSTISDYPLIADASDNYKIKRTHYLHTSLLQDPNAHTNIGTNANAVQTTINTNIDTALSGKANSSHTQASSTITDTNTYSNIGNSSQTQDSINSAIDTKLGQLSNIDALIMVDTLPTASSSTMGKLYVINENSKINFYWTKRTGTSPSYTYAWEKMDTDILDELVVSWSDVQSKPSTFPPSQHFHDDEEIVDINYFESNYREISPSDEYLDNVLLAIDDVLVDKGAKTSDVDWSYNSNGFTNGVKLVSKSDNANGRITLHMDS